MRKENKQMARILALFLSFSLLISLLEIPVLAEAGVMPIVNVDFQSDPIDATVSDDWTHVPVGSVKSADGTVKVVADPGNPANNMLMLNGTSAGASITFEEQTGKVTSEFKMLFDAYDVFTVRFRYGVSSNQMQAVSLIARATGSLEYNNGSNAVKFISGVANDKYELNKWYNVKIEADIASGKYDLYIDGVKVNGSEPANFANAASGAGGGPIVKLNCLSFNNTSATTTGKLYVDDVHIFEPISENEPSTARYTFEDETIDTMPGYPWEENGTVLGKVKVAVDPENSGNKVMFIEDSSNSTNARSMVNFTAQNGGFTAKFRVRYTAKDVYTVNLMETADASKLGVSFIARGTGKLSVYNGSTEVQLADYEVNTWYDVKMTVDVAAQKFSVSINGEEKISNASFRHSGITAIEYLMFGTTGATIGNMYIDDVDVPEAPEQVNDIPRYNPVYKNLQMLYDAESNTGLAKPGQTYSAFPSIIEMDNDEIFIVYKQGYSHMNDDGDMEAIIYNSATETVVSRFVIDDEVSENAQNPEVLRMPNGDLVIYNDIQRTTSSGRQRIKIKEYRSTDNGRTWNVVRDSLKDNTGIEYGYTFDDAVIGDRIYMLAMTFPEFDNQLASPGRSVHMIYSDDNGETWIHLKNLNEEFGYAFNESTFEPYEDGFVVFTRGDAQSTRIYVTDINMNVEKSRILSGNVDCINASGRPKLFIKDGEYYVLMRGYPSNTSGMKLVLHKFDMETLLPVNCIILDSTNGDGFYAEPYFKTKNGMEYFNAITYCAVDSSKPDVIRLEYAWEELVRMNPVDTNPPVWPENSLTLQNITETGADLSWCAASDDTAVLSYEIFQNNASLGKVDFSDVEETVFSLPGAKVNYANQGEVYLVMPKNVPQGVTLPVVIGVHGSGGSALVFRDHPMYKNIKELALKYGYIFVALSNGQDAWGTDDGFYNLNLLYAYIQDNYQVDQKAVLYAYSAGGTLAYRMIKEYPEKVDFMVGTYPVYDMTSFTGTSAQAAWGVNNYNDYAAAVASVNPSHYPEALVNHRIYLSHGSVDTAVPVESNSQKLKDDVTALGGSVELQIVVGKGHDSTVPEYYTTTANNAFKINPAQYIMTVDDLVDATSYGFKVRASDQYNTSDSNTILLETSFAVDVAAAFDSFRAILGKYYSAGTIEQPVFKQLMNSLDQAQHHDDKGDQLIAAKHLEDLRKHLNNKAMGKKIEEGAKEVLLSNAASMITMLLK